MQYLVYVKEENEETDEFESCLEFSFETYSEASSFIDYIVKISNYTIILKRNGE